MDVYLNSEQLNKKKRGWRVKIYLLFFAGSLIGIGLFYLTAYSPVFQIKKFLISGNDRLSEEAIFQILEPQILTGKVKKFLGLKNLFSWNASDLKLSETALLEATINRDWLSQTVNIAVKERERIAIWCDKNDSCFWIDEEAAPFEPAPVTEGSLILTVFDHNSEGAILNKRVVEERFAKNLISILKGISSFNLAVKRMAYDKILQEIKVENYGGPDLYFSIRFDPKLSFASLKSLSEKIGLKGIKYVDLRVENRIYYKNY